jgi:hypothetical protein
MYPIGLSSVLGPSVEDYLENPEIEDKIKLDRLKKDYEQLRFHIQYSENPRDRYQRYLLEAKQVDCKVDHYIIEEINRMKDELDR